MAFALQPALRDWLSDARDLLAGARRFADDTVDRAGDVAARFQKDAEPYRRYAMKAPYDFASAAGDRLKDYGLTPEALASLASSQARHVTRVARRHPISFGTVLAIGAAAALCYAIMKEREAVRAPNIIRSRD